VSENSPAAMCGLKSGDYIVKVNGQNVSRAQQRTVSNIIKYKYLVFRKKEEFICFCFRHIKHSVTLDIHRYPNVSLNRNLFSLVSSTGTLSTEDSSTYSDSSISYQGRNLPPLPPPLSPPLSNRQFIDLAQLGHYIEPKPYVRQTTKNSGKPFYEMINSSMLAMKGSPTNTAV